MLTFTSHNKVPVSNKGGDIAKTRFKGNFISLLQQGQID